MSGERERIGTAKEICLRCPVRAECLEYSIENDCVGIWGGMDTGERRDYARRSR